MLGFNQAPTEGDPPIVALASEWWLARIRTYIWPGFFGAGLILKRGLIESPCHESGLKMSPYIHNPHPVHDQNANTSKTSSFWLRHVVAPSIVSVVVVSVTVVVVTVTWAKKETPLATMRLFTTK